MKVLVILIGVFSAVSAEEMKCNGADGATAEACDDGVVACTSPVWSEYGGMSAQAYGCGACPADSTATCAQCDAKADEGCNVKVAAPADAQTFECFDYSLVKEALVASKTATTCNANKATAIKCNSPGTAAVAKTYKVANKGCGGCTEAAIKDKTCSECCKTKCNSASTLAFVLAPLLAVIFHVL
ncbi:uncharacterized protein LOC134824990 [Bolinopsis microptera]|uniref:uncharacterized protein LOC134824990 n=1 Tax=Bolinopsis microptera TaxID=2820187 RepID=UPI0030790B4F